MLLYNVTVKVDTSIAEEWLIWINNEHVPEVLNTGCFTKASILKLLEVDDSEGPTYCIQYICESKASYDKYIDSFAGTMRDKGFQKWGNKFIAFRSIMQFVN